MGDVESQPIPFAQGQASGLDELSGLMPSLMNFMPDAAGGLYQRPGIQTWSDFPSVIPNASPVIGIYEWRGYVLYVCEDRTIWALIAPGLVQALSDTTDPLTMLDGTGRPIWTYDQERVVVTGGGAPQQWQAVGLSSRLVSFGTAPDGSPLTLTHIAYSAQRFIGNVNSNAGYLQWTAPGASNHTAWPIVGPYYSEAEAAPDPVLAVFANTNEVFAFGTETTQVYSPDPDIAFTVAASLQLGCAAAYSVIETESGEFGWLDNNRRFVMSNGRNFDVISSPGMDATIKGLSDVTDCWAANIRIGSLDLLVWSFHVERRCFWYDRTTKKWGEWSSIDSNGDQQAWIAQSYFYWNERNTHLVGLADGRIAEMSLEAALDDALPIVAVAETGFQDRGTFVRKACRRAQLQFRRGSTPPPATAPTVSLRYRDDLGAWKPAITFSMGAAEYQPVVDRWALGMYRQRQWRLEWSGGSEFFLAGATETFEPGES